MLILVEFLLYFEKAVFICYYSLQNQKHYTPEKGSNNFMKFESEFLFLKKILNSQRILCHLIISSQNTYPEFDLGLRKFLNPALSYDTLCKKITDFVRPNTILRLQDELLCHYYLLAVPDFLPEEKTVLLIGPYVGNIITVPLLTNLGERLKLKPSILSQLEKYYSDLPVVSDETWFISILSSFGEIIWSSPENFHIENVSWQISDDLLPVTVQSDSFGQNEPLLTMKALEKRYALENSFMKAVSQGLTHAALTLTFKNSFSSLENRLHDPIRDLKNYSIVLNTLLRKAAEAGGVHPVHIDSLSSRFARKIELITSTNEGYSLQNDMIRKYCLLVKNNSLNSYSQLVQKVLTRVDTDLTVDLSLKAHANLLNTNPSYLSTLFKKEVGMTLTDYVTKKRIEHAIFLLNTTQMQVQTIAEHCGIQDVNYFTKTFKKLVGMTPKEYRKSISST